ncbi:MAG: DUF1365 family protein [Betaproteobacteria bacterium]|nr:DUF1365 family protein [Betaproteobacteria bacterium]
MTALATVVLTDGARPAALLFRGEVMHARVRPRRHAFRYRVFFLRLRLGDEDRARRGLLSVDRFNLFSFHRRDHGPRDGRDLLGWIRELLRNEGVAGADGEVWLQAFPRVLGYVFNPVSFWLCHDREGRLRAVLCEVNNTFGESHNYLVCHADGRPIEPGDELSARKVFHVSPFFRVEGAYRFRFETAPARTCIRIDYDGPDGRLLATSVSGSGEALTTTSLIRCFFVYPWLTLGVILRIHWQALKLWRKGMPFFGKPEPPVRGTTR